MRKMSIDETRNVNGGTYECRLCGYKNSSYWNVYSHVLFTHTLPLGLSIISIILAL